MERQLMNRNLRRSQLAVAVATTLTTSLISAVAFATNPAPMNSKFTGDYEVVGRPWRFTLSLRGGKPVIAWNEIRMSALKRIDADTWFSPLDWAKLTFRFRDDGSFEGSFALPGGETLVVRRK